MQCSQPGYAATPLPPYPLPPTPPHRPLDVSPELCFDVSSEAQLSSILKSQNRHLSIHMHQGTFFFFHPLPLPQPPLSLSLSPSLSPSLLAATSLHSLSSINPAGGYERPRASPLRAVSHVITIIYKAHSGSLVQSASPSPRPCTLQSIFARNPELLSVSTVVRASIT